MSNLIVIITISTLSFLLGVLAHKLLPPNKLISRILIFATIFVAVLSVNVSAISKYDFFINYILNRSYISSYITEKDGKNFVTKNELSEIVYNIDNIYKRLYDEKIKSVVYLYGSNGNVFSGTIIKDNMILTCAHGIKDKSETVSVVLSNLNVYSGTVYKIDYQKDLCLIQITESLKSPTLKIKNSEITESVFFIGNGSNYYFRFRKGYVIKSNEIIYSLNGFYTHFDMVVVQGDSGSGVFNLNGELVSVVVRVDGKDSNLSYGVTYYDIKSFLKESNIEL